MSRNKEVGPVVRQPPSNLAVECAISIANYCLARFPCDTPPHPMLDVPWFAEKVQRCIDEACRIGRELRRSLEKADAAIRLALALTDTGSPEFRAAFPPVSAGEVVPGWHVVEKIREVLLGA